MNKFIVFLALCMLITINSKVVSSCPPCNDVNGEKRYCVKLKVINLKECVAGSRKGGRCKPAPEADGSYDGFPPCREGLTCSATMNGKCE